MHERWSWAQHAAVRAFAILNDNKTVIFLELSNHMSL